MLGVRVPRRPLFFDGFGQDIHWFRLRKMENSTKKGFCVKNCKTKTIKNGARAYIPHLNPIKYDHVVCGWSFPWLDCRRNRERGTKLINNCCCFATFVWKNGILKGKEGICGIYEKERMNNKEINLAHNNTQKTERMESESSHWLFKVANKKPVATNQLWLLKLVIFEDFCQMTNFISLGLQIANLEIYLKKL